MDSLSTQITEGIVEDLEIRLVTKYLVEHLLFDLPISAWERAEYGIYTDMHAQALKAVLEHDADQVDVEDGFESLRKTILKLDQAAGSGQKLNALVREFAPAYAAKVQFRTAMDVFLRQTDDVPLQSG